MTNQKDALESKLQALSALLDDPHAEDDDWAVDLLYTLEAIYEIARHPDKKVVDASRANPVVTA